MTAVGLAILIRSGICNLLAGIPKRIYSHWGASGHKNLMFLLPFNKVFEHRHEMGLAGRCPSCYSTVHIYGPPHAHTNPLGGRVEPAMEQEIDIETPVKIDPK